MFVAQEVRLISVAKLMPYARNSRTHSAAQVSAVASSIREFGFTSPVLVRDDGTIVAGHGRVLAARTLGMIDVPCINVGHLSDAQMRAYVIADNKLAEQAGWDDDLLKLEFADLRDVGFDLGFTGFSQDDIDAMLAAAGTAGKTDPDAIPQIPCNPVSRIGDLWVTGRHRLICGDSTDADVVTRLMAGITPHLMVTDPPYGVEYDPNWRNEADRANGESYGARATGQVLNDDRADWREAWALFPGDVAYVWHAGLYAGEVQNSLESAGFEIRSQIIWSKPRFAISRGHYHWQHEPCWYAVRKGATGHWQGDRSQTTLWSISHNKSETGHGTQKPVEAMRRPIENNSSAGQAVYEPFSGSGTTIIAAEQTGRCCYAVELSPAYVDVAIKRWQDFTGGGAVLDGDGRIFNEIAVVGRG